jgi:SAM-dependent methyltransferase
MLTKKEILKLPFRGRDLNDFENEVGNISMFIDSNLSIPFRILEIGCGFGQLLFDLKIKYSSKVELYGINLEAGSVSIDRVLRVAKYRKKIPAKYQLSAHDIHFSFCDAGESIPFDDNFFNLIISQFAIVYIKDKSKLIEEMNRVLHPNGKALLWTGFENNKKKSGYWSSFDILDKGKYVDLVSYFARFPNIVYLMHPGGSILEMRKSNTMNMKINLVSLSDLSTVNPLYFGYKSIYIQL